MKLSRQLRGEALRFAVVGGVCFLISTGIYMLICPYMASWLATGVAYVISFCANFFLTCFFTFKEPPTLKRLVGMASAHGINMCLTMALTALAEYLGCPKQLCILPATAVATVFNFFMVRFFFRH